jgi:hypothetical protein
MGGRRPPLTTAPVADSQRPQGPLFKHALARIAKGDGLDISTANYEAPSIGSPMIKPSGMRHAVEGLSPYQSLLLLAIPTSLIEPLKLIGVAVAGKGHWITGTAMVVAAYIGSLLLVERLFRIVKPKLLALPWFARFWSAVIAFRRKTMCWLRSWI